MKIFDILNEKLLVEGRKEDALKKYPEWANEIEFYISNDPSGNNKYLMWIMNFITEHFTHEDIKLSFMREVGSLVTKFHENLAKITNNLVAGLDVSDAVKNKPKDINSYTTLAELRDVISQSERKLTRKNVKDADFIYEDENFKVYVPLSVASSCKYGAGTRWCTAATGSDNRYLQYSKSGILFYFLQKNVNNEDELYKVALHISNEGEAEWYNAPDSRVPKPSFVDPAMNSVNKYYEENKDPKKRLFSQFMKSPTIESYESFKYELTDEVKKTVIEKILKSLGSEPILNANFKSIIPDLNPEQFKYLVGLVKKDQDTDVTQKINELITATDEKNYKLLKTLYPLLTTKPKLLNNSDIVSFFNKLLTQDEKNEVISKIKIGDVRNTDNLVLLKSWSMNPAEIKELYKTSYYVYLMDSNGTIEKLVKVNPLDPESYRTVNAMKLRKVVQNQQFYGIKTTKDMLDEYLTMSYEDMPSEVLTAIKEKSVRI